MKKFILPVLLTIFLVSCSQVAEKPRTTEKPAEIRQVSIGKYEVPNGKEYEFVSFGTGFHFKKSEGSLSDSYTSTGEIQKYLKEQNPLIVSEYVDALGKKYQISNYKGTTVTDGSGKKIEKAFSNDQEARSYLESLAPVACDVTSKVSIPKDNGAYGNLNGKFKVEAKKYAGKIRSVRFQTLGKCEGGKVSLETDKNGKVTRFVPGIASNEYSYSDGIVTTLISASQGGYGFGGGYPDEEDVPVKKTSTEKIPGNSEGSMGDVMITEYTNGTFQVAMYIDGVGFNTSKPVSKNAFESVMKDFRFIGKTLSVSVEIPQFSWNELDKNGVRFLGSLSDGDIDKGYKGNGAVFTSHGIEKVIYLSDGKTLFWDCSTSAFDCAYKGYDQNSHSVILDIGTFNNMTQTLGKKETYTINVDTGKATLK